MGETIVSSRQHLVANHSSSLRYTLVIVSALFMLHATSQEKAPPPLNAQLADIPWTPPSAAEKVVYGTDDRIDVFNEIDPGRLIYAASTCALISNSRLTANGNGTFTILTSAYTYSGLNPCVGEPFATQPVAAFCSGFMVQDDLIATAGNCIASENDLNKFSFVFGFDMVNAITPTVIVDADRVYAGSELLSWVPGGADDHALVRVDRDITAPQAIPLPVRSSGTVAVLAPVGTIGHPGGLPKKISFGNQTGIIDVSNPSYFVANLDVAAGSAGSPVINRGTGEVEGIVARGVSDFFNSGGCFLSTQFPDPQGSIESTRISILLPCLLNGNCSPGTEVPCNGAPHLTGTLSASSPHYDRIANNGTIDLNCNAPSNDPVFDNMPYAAFPIMSATTENFQAQVQSMGTNIADTVLSLYCDAFDPANPANSLIAFNDDFQGDFLSGFAANDNILLQANTRYWLVLSTYDGNDLDFGDFEICLGGGFMDEGQTVIDDGLIHASPAPPFIEEGSTLQLSRPFGTAHMWFKDNVLIVNDPPRVTGANSSVLTFSPIISADEGVYTVQYNDGTKAIVTSPPLTFTVLPPNSLTALTFIGLGFLAGACALMGTRKLHNSKHE